MEERKAGGADSKPFIGKWTGNYGTPIESGDICDTGEEIKKEMEENQQAFKFSLPAS